jgi:hypothetical protein
VRHPAELAHLAPFGQRGAGGDGRVEAAEPRAAGADGLGQRALREEAHLDRAPLRRGHRLGVAREEGADGPGELPVAQQAPAAQPGLPHVVADVRQAPHAGLGQRVQQVHRVAGHPEAAGHQDVAVPHEPRRLGGRDPWDLSHTLSPMRAAPRG